MRKKNPVTKEITCVICDFPLSAEAENGWFEHVAKTKHLFLRNLQICAILQNTHSLHHSHITGEIFGYAHTFCNEKVRENYYRIPVIAHNLFRFDFFMVKGLRVGAWKTRDIVIWGKTSTDINFAHIGNQVQFIDTIKYFQQSLAALAGS